MTRNLFFIIAFLSLLAAGCQQSDDSAAPISAQSPVQVDDSAHSGGGEKKLTARRHSLRA